MKVRNIVRKAAVLGSGVAMLGATMAGAMAYDLTNYPASFIADGMFDGKIIVGERAATADVIGSIDIAASLQASSTSSVALPGAAGQVALTGDSFKISTGSDSLELREPVGSVVDTITESDLTGLKSGKITTSEGVTDYKQYLRLKDGALLQNMSVNVVENDDNVITDYLVVDSDAPFLEWEVQFPQGLESKIDDNGRLTDMEDRVFNMMGTDFNIVSVTNTSGTIEMTLMGGSVADTLREGETRTYSIDGVDYEVTLVFVSDPNSGGNPEVKFSVNGELTQSLGEADTDTLSGGLQIGVRDILVNAREGVASFFLGADKVVFRDTTPTVADDFSGTVEVNNENIDDGEVTILGSSTSATKFKISSIKYRLTMDSSSGSIAYIPVGKGIKENMRRPEGLISDSLDVKYEGLEEVESTDFKLVARGKDRYQLQFTNLNGEAYTVPFFSNRNGVAKFGDDNDDLVLVEPANAAYNIGRNDYFIVSSDNDGDKQVTNVLRYESFDKTDKTLNLRDLSTGTTKVAIQGTTSGTGSLVIGGHTYDVNVSDVTISEPTIAVDLNGNGAIANTQRVTITTWGGVEIDPTANVWNGTTNTVALSTVNGDSLGFADLADYAEDTAKVNMTATVLAKQFDTSDNGAESFDWTIQGDTGNEVTLSFNDGGYDGPLFDPTNLVEGRKFEFTDNPDDDEHTIATTDYGIGIDQYDPTGSNKPSELTLSIPKMQRLAQVFVTLGSVEKTAGGAGTSTQVNPIAVGLAVLDRDAPAVGSENLIVVGGPCANTVAAELLGNPENCAEGFEPGKAIIRAWDKTSTVAILVAGYESQETLGASRVLAQYEDYSLSGDEVEVVVADLNSITVQKPSA